jgi:hypothetical protein
MPDSLELPALYVEGESDLHAIVHLLARHGIELDQHLGPVVIKNAKSDKGVLDSMRTAARASTNRAVGFVVDADGTVAQRWRSVCEHLKDLGLNLPEVAPASGFVGDSPISKGHVGVWIMPDNVTDAGKLEDLMRTLVPAGDVLIGHARDSTVQAVARGAQFPAQDRLKAELHCWLAWQKEPGLSFGTALKAHFFRHDSDVALRFVEWFKRLYALP